MLDEPLSRHQESAVTAAIQTSLPQRVRLRVANCTIRRCETVIFDSADHLLDGAQRLVNRMVAIVLMGIAMFAVVASVVTLATTAAPASAAMTSALDSMLFAVILVEITATMRREERRSKLKWYLVIGIISGVREIMTVGARMSLHPIPAREVSSVVLEMAMTIVVVIGLCVALRLADRDRPSSQPARSRADRVHSERHAPGREFRPSDSRALGRPDRSSRPEM